MLKASISLFFTGIILGTGPCLASCGPILISYIAGTKTTIPAGLRSWFIFSISRVGVYIFLGLIAGFAGSGLFRSFYWEKPGYIIWLLGGAFISFLGALIFFRGQARFKACCALNEALIQKDAKSLAVLGILVGVFPCVPLLGVLSYITMISTHFVQGLVLSACFGLGTLFSPLIFLGMAAGAIAKLKVLQEKRNLIIFQKICGLVLCLLGAHIIIKTILEYTKSL